MESCSILSRYEMIVNTLRDIPYNTKKNRTENALRSLSYFAQLVALNCAAGTP